MKLIESLVDAFIMTFGITPPRPETRRLANIFIFTAMVLTVAAVLGLLIAALTHLLH
ncbi:MAG TPA: hypothetical protein VM865_04910 [Acidobacteriaceae bacterium]|jgi:hypothetical protein|nr:hypothetical protein [Acidobacteriaceae bacterium]